MNETINKIDKIPGNMPMTPLVSIIITTYNRSNLLPRALKSVLNQTYPNLEIIIVDDGSIDNTDEVIKSFKDPRIIACRHRQNKGVPGAKNTGLDLSHGKFICFVDDDCEILPEAIETIVKEFNELASKGVKIIWVDAMAAESKKLCGYGISSRGFIKYEDYLCGNYKGDYWVIFDREAIGSNRFDERLYGGEDELLLRLHRQYKAFYAPIVLAIAYVEHERVSNTHYKNLPKVVLTRKVYLEEYGNEWKSIAPHIYGQKVAELGFMQVLNGEHKEGRKTLIESFKYYLSPKYF